LQPCGTGSRTKIVNLERRQDMQEVRGTIDVWTYRDTSRLGADVLDPSMDISGYKVEALDGSIGKVDEATYDLGQSHIVVDTGPWIFGKKVMLPAGIVKNIDSAEEQVFVNRTKDQIKNAPEFDDSLLADDAYRSSVGTYYGPGGMAYRDWDDDPSRN
jgi:hypothetical protein